MSPPVFDVDEGLVGCLVLPGEETQDKKISKGHIPRVVYNVYNDNKGHHSWFGVGEFGLGVKGAWM
jgi:hypothetical protein